MASHVPDDGFGEYRVPQAISRSRRRAVLAAAAFLTLVVCILLPGVAIPYTVGASSSARSHADQAVEAAVADVVVHHVAAPRGRRCPQVRDREIG